MNTESALSAGQEESGLENSALSENVEEIIEGEEEKEQKVPRASALFVNLFFVTLFCFFLSLTLWISQPAQVVTIHPQLNVDIDTKEPRNNKNANNQNIVPFERYRKGTADVKVHFKLDAWASSVRVAQKFTMAIASIGMFICLASILVYTYMSAENLSVADLSGFEWVWMFVNVKNCFWFALSVMLMAGICRFSYNKMAYGEPEKAFDAYLKDAKITPEQKAALRAFRKYIDDPNDLPTVFNSRPIDELYRLGSLLGEGGFGKVFKAVEIKTGKSYAAKQNYLTLPTEKEKASVKVSTLERTIHEMLFMRMFDHPNLIKFKDTFIHGNDFWVIMELGTWGNVEHLVRKCAGLTELQIAAILKQMLEGLKYLHGMKIMHRVIKPGNALLNRDGRVIIIDFGYAAQLIKKPYRRNRVGTVYYVPPEAAKHERQNCSLDIWSLGIMAIELQTTSIPWFQIQNDDRKVAAVIAKFGKPKVSWEPSVSVEFRDFVDRCLTIDPVQRPSAEELLKHPFIANAPPPSYLVEAIERKV